MQEETVVETTENEEEIETETTEEEQTEVETESDETTTEEETEVSETEDDDEIFVTVGEEEAPPQEEETNEAPEWVKDVRKQNRELQKKVKELEKQTAVVEEKKPTTLPAKPTLEDFDYDSEKFETALDDWHEKKIEVTKQQNILKEEENKQAAAWNKTLNDYSEAKKVTKIRNYDQAEAVVEETLSIEQQAIILKGAKKNSVLLVAAIGSNPERAKQLASIKDPIDFAFAVAEMGTKLKTHKKKAPNADTKVNGEESKGVGGSQKELDKLRTEAQKTGDFSKVTAYKKKLNKAS
jgi:hypothetical protein